jgi:hypothetical protein
VATVKNKHTIKKKWVKSTREEKKELYSGKANSSYFRHPSTLDGNGYRIVKKIIREDIFL